VIVWGFCGIFLGVADILFFAIFFKGNFGFLDYKQIVCKNRKNLRLSSFRKVQTKEFHHSFLLILMDYH